jgi:hypothetical protein
MPAGARYAAVSQGGGELTRRLSTPDAATADSRLFETDPDGTLTVYDVNTGRQLDRRPATAPPLLEPADQLFAFVSDETLYRVWPGYMDGYDLRLGKVTTFFTAPPNRHIAQITVCGTGRMCIQVVQPAPCSSYLCVNLIGPPSSDPLFLDMVQTNDLGILWEQPEMAYGAVEASGDRILAEGSELFDRDGHRLLVLPDTVAAWVSPDGVLLVDDRGTSLSSLGDMDAEVFLGDATSDRQTSIGTLRDVTGRCAVDLRTLVCPAIDGLYAWRF